MSAFGQDRPATFQEALKAITTILSSSPNLRSRGAIPVEAERILEAAHEQVSGRKLPRIELYSRAGDRIREDISEKALVLAAQRAGGKPLQHLTGTQQFLEHEYAVGPAALVPRPETEVLVTVAVSELSSRAPAFGLEIGVGSGIIAIELLARFSSLKVLASELSGPARDLATRNAKQILGPGTEQAGRLQIRMAADPMQVFEPFRGAEPADFIISNPPYLTRGDEIEADVLQHEPESALFPPVDGGPSYFYAEIAEHGREYLKKGGGVFVEIPHERAQSIHALFTDRGWSAKIFQDLTGRDRVLMAR